MQDAELRKRVEELAGRAHAMNIPALTDEILGVVATERLAAAESARQFAESVIENDKTMLYEYSGKRSLKRNGQAPDAGQRWLTPREMAREFLRKFAPARTGDKK